MSACTCETLGTCAPCEPQRRAALARHGLAPDRPVKAPRTNELAQGPGRVFPSTVTNGSPKSRGSQAVEGELSPVGTLARQRATDRSHSMEPAGEAFDEVEVDCA